MGWWSIEGTPANRRPELVKQYVNGGATVIDAKTVGSTTFIAVDNKGESYVVVFLYEKHDGQWLEKSISEDAGPCAVNCPLSLIKKTKGCGGYSQEWRKDVIAYHEKIAKTKTLKAGDVVEVYGHNFVISHKKGRSWIAADAGGKLFRLPTKDINILIKGSL